MSHLETPSTNPTDPEPESEDSTSTPDSIAVSTERGDYKKLKYSISFINVNVSKLYFVSRVAGSDKVN